MRRLIVNADDFGLTEGVTRGIVEGHQSGVISSTCLLANMPAATFATSLARTVPRLGVGLHLNLTCFRPVLPPEEVPSLVNENGWFYFNTDLVAARADITDVEKEFRAQLARFKELGLPLSHIDLHMGTTRADILSLVGRLAAEEKVGARRPPVGYGGGEADGIVSALRELGVRLPDVTDYIFMMQPMTKEGFIARLHELPEGTTEIVTHPGYISVEHQFVDDYTAWREEELRVLTDPEVREAVAREGIELISFHEL